MVISLWWLGIVYKPLPAAELQILKEWWIKGHFFFSTIGKERNNLFYFIFYFSIFLVLWLRMVDGTVWYLYWKLCPKCPKTWYTIADLDLASVCQGQHKRVLCLVQSDTLLETELLRYSPAKIRIWILPALELEILWQLGPKRIYSGLGIFCPEFEAEQWSWKVVSVAVDPSQLIPVPLEYWRIGFISIYLFMPNYSKYSQNA